MLSFGVIELALDEPQASPVYSVFIAPNGQTFQTTDVERLVHKLFGMSVNDLEIKYNTTVGDALLSRGMIYADGGIIQVETPSGNITNAQIDMISQYLQHVPLGSHVSITGVEHDVQSLQLLSESLLYEGRQDDALAALEAQPTTTPVLWSQNTPGYNYVPGKGSGGGASSGPSTWQRTFKVDPRRASKLISVQSLGGLRIKYADIAGARPPVEVSTSRMGYHLGMPVIEIDGHDYAVGTDSMADSAAKEYILESVYVFNSWFLDAHMPEGITEDAIKAIQQGYESSNDVLRGLLVDEDHFVADAISSDGRGNFLGTYDNEEHELQTELGVQPSDLPSEVLEALEPLESGEMLYAYRIS